MEIWSILILYIIAGISSVPTFNAILYEGDSCIIRGKTGICTHQDKCLHLMQAFYDHRISNDEIPRCGYSIKKEIICCPIENSPEYPTSRSAMRPAVEYCKQIEQNTQPLLTEHIMNGIPASIGEYPHMAAIGYRRFGNDKQPYEYSCGGSLISSKFVLSAAHCVTDPRRQPELVLLGAISLTVTNEGVRVNVTRTFPHPQYVPSSTYHDIALLELESEVDFTDNIYPICLHSNESDLPSNTELHVSGWGQTEKNRPSDVLLTAKVDLVSLDVCNQRISTMGSWRKLARGVQDTQICAQGAESDACSGDSGGPLIFIKNKDLGQFRAVGVTVAGFNCGGGIPSFYSRVSAYLDFIEEIVWPNDKAKF